MVKMRFSYIAGDGMVLSVMGDTKEQPYFGRKIFGILFVDQEGSLLASAGFTAIDRLDKLEVDVPVKRFPKTVLDFGSQKEKIGKAGICLVNGYGYPHHHCFLAIREDVAQFKIVRQYLTGAVSPTEQRLLHDSPFCAEQAECCSELLNFTFHYQLGSFNDDLVPLRKEFYFLFEDHLKKISTPEEYLTLFRQGEEIIGRMKLVRNAWAKKQMAWQDCR